MSPVQGLHYDIIAEIIDIIGETKNQNVLKELALVSHSFLQICRKHLFATIKLHSANYSIASSSSSKKGFVKLLKSRPDAINYIRKLTYEVSDNNDDDHLLSPILSNFLPTVSRLNSLTIIASHRDWNTLDSSLTSAFLHLMRLPTINHIDLSYIKNFPLSSLTPSVNLLRLDLVYLKHFEYFDENLQSDTMPKLREFRTSYSSLLTTKLLRAKRRDGQPAFNFTDLRRLSMSLSYFEDEQNIRYLLQNAKSLENLHLTVDDGRSIEGILSLRASTLKVLDLSVSLYHHRVRSLAGLCGELEAMAGHNMLEALSLQVSLGVHHTVDFIGSRIQKVENVLAKPGWSALRRVSLKLTIIPWGDTTELTKALQTLPDKYLSHLPKFESVAFNYSAYLA